MTAIHPAPPVRPLIRRLMHYLKILISHSIPEYLFIPLHIFYVPRRLSDDKLSQCRKTPQRTDRVGDSVNVFLL